MLGVNMVERRPELFAAYVGSGQFINAADGDALGYDLTLKQARAVNDTAAITALEAMGPPPWLDVRTRSAAKGWAMRMTKDGDPAGMAFSTEPLTQDGATFDARAFGPRFPVPLLIFQGEDDFNTPTALVRRWFDTTEAPTKAMTVVPNASHAAFYTHAGQLGQWLTDRLASIVGK